LYTERDEETLKAESGGGDLSGHSGDWRSAASALEDKPLM